ncbi:MAG: hypothetical protein AAGK04_11455, partial [Planctomycetota bacterium]
GARAVAMGSQGVFVNDQKVFEKRVIGFSAGRDLKLVCGFQRRRSEGQTRGRMTPHLIVNDRALSAGQEAWRSHVLEDGTATAVFLRDEEIVRVVVSP